MYRSVFVSLALACAAVAVTATTTVAARPDGNNDDGDGGGDNLLDAVLDRCSMGPGAVRCLKSNVLEYLQDGRETGRGGVDDAAASATDIDERLVRATGEYIGRHVTETAPPPTIARPGRAMENADASASAAVASAPQQPTTTTTTTARADMEMGMMQDKMLMPLMMMMKMKLKMLMPIMMAVISMKATKALIISKVAILLVLGFLVKEFLKKSGLPGLPLHLPGLPGSEPSTTTSPPPMYGPPQSSGYESSGSWEPAGYSSHSSDSAHSMAYNSYLPSSSSSSSAGSSAGLSSAKY